MTNLRLKTQIPFLFSKGGLGGIFLHLCLFASLLLSSCGGSGSNSGTTYTIGGTISGLSGTVVLQNNGADDLSVTADGSFTFVTALADAATYSVAVLTQPTGQTCTVSDGSGTVSGANVTNVTVTCASYTIGGTISGLIGTVVMQNNSADDLSVTANGTFTFATSLADAATYEVSVLTQPTNQTCTVSSGTGTVSGANVTSVTVACVDTYPRIFVTASTFTGNLGGVAGADSSCMSDANYPGAGTYKALISDGSTRIACTTANCGGGVAEHTDWVLAASTNYVRSDGTTMMGLTNAGGVLGDLTRPFTDTTGLAIWTGLNNNWTSVADTDNCTKWTLTTTNGRKGTPSETTNKYIDNGSQSCGNSAYLLCVEQ